MSKTPRYVHGHASGGSNSPTYMSWSAMRERCLNPKADKYPQYGARGISICERWHSFESFLADMGERPHGKTLDRKDNDGNYELSNCRWATHKEQQNNRRANVFVEHDGERLTVTQWSERLGMVASTIRARLKRGYSADRALSLNSFRGRYGPQWHEEKAA